MRWCCLCVLILLPTCQQGCFNPADLGKKREAPANGNLIAPGDLDDLAGGGAGAQQAQPAPAVAAPVAAPPVDFDKLSWRLVDKKKEMEARPHLIVKSTAKLGGQAQDYLTAVSQAYVSAKTRIYVMALQHELDLQRALNDFKFPSFEQFSQSLKQANVELENVYPWEVYAYDQEAGEIQLLEDPVLKRKMRQERGLPVD